MAADGRGPDVVEKIGRLLRAIGSSGGVGLTTSQAARRSDLTRPTAHRLLVSLGKQGLVDRDVDTGDWHVGPELYLLGGVAASRYDVTRYARDVLASLAARTGESVYLSAARGYETVCLLEEEGSFPLRSHVLYVGIRFPLGVASAGLAILSHMPASEREAYLSTTNLVPAWGHTHSRTALRDRIKAALETGYVINPGLIVDGSWGMGAAVFDRAGRPAWAISITGVEARLRPPRQQQLGHLLLDHAHRLTKRLARQ